MPWQVVEFDVQEEEATVNLQNLDQNVALYRVDELAKILSDGDVGAFPINTSTAVSAGAFSISVFNEINIFDAKQLDLVGTLSLETIVDTMAWSSDSQFLVIGDNSGTIHFYSYACGDVLFSTAQVNIASGKSTSIFCNCIFTRDGESGNDINLMIMSTDGVLFSFENLPLRDLSSALESKDLSYINKFKENIQMKTMEVAGMDEKASYFNAATIFGKSSFIVAASGSAAVSIWSDQNIMDIIDCELLGGANVRKCQMSPNSKYIVVLDEHSNLSTWDAHTLVMLQAVPSSGIKDFILTTSATTNETDAVGSDSGQVVLLKDNGDHPTKLEIYQLPQFQKTYSMEVSHNCYLTDSSCYQEKVFYLEVNANKVNNNSVPVITLVYKCLSAASPEHRVRNLVRKKKFDSALEFSRAFGLDVEFVYKAKSSCILADITGIKKSESDIDLEEKVVSVDTLIEELQDSLENVKSVEFCVDCCLKASLPTLEQVYKLHCFAKEKVRKVSGKEKHGCSQMMIEVLHSIHRLETFKMVFEVASFTADRWQQFSRGDMLTYVMQFLIQGKMSNAAIIWRRHQSEFEINLTAEILKNILASVRSDLPSASIIPWVRSYLVPLVLHSSVNEEIIHVLASWMEQRVASLELSEKDDWPNNGLEMALLVFDVLSELTEENSNYKDIPTTLFVNQVHGSAIVQVCKKDSKPNPVSSLSRLVEHLSELKKLYANYHCKIPLAKFTKETPLGIMFIMLDSVLAIELIPSVIHNQITQYGIQHGIQIDDALLKYINHQIKQVSVSNLSNTLCEARLVEITKCIKTRTMYFEAILQLMAWASVPWSSVVEEMVSNAMADDPSNESLKWSYRLMEFKKTIIHYGLRGIEFSNDSHVKGVIKYILGTLNDKAIEDALQIAETYHCFTKEEVYFTRLQNLCLKGLLSECIKLLKIVPRPQVMSAVIKRFLSWISVTTKDLPVDEPDFKERVVIIEAAIHILEHLCNARIGQINHDMDKTLLDLKNILALQKEFSIVITLDSYQDVDAKEEIILTYIRDHNMSKSTFVEKKEESNTRHQDEVSRLASLFGLSCVQLQSKILLQNLTDGNKMSPLNYLTTSSKMACELSSDEIFNLCMVILQHCITQGADVITTTETNIPKILYGLACSAVTHGEASSLDDYLELSKLCWLSTSLCSHCESGDLSLSMSVWEEDPLLPWSNTNRFQDNGFVLDANIALPLHHKVLTSLMLVHQDPAENLEKMAIVCQDLVAYLEENNLHEVALHYGLHSISHLLKHSTVLPEPKNTAQEINSDNDVTEENPKVKLVKDMSLHGTNHIANMLLNLMLKVLHNSNIDQNLALGYLCSVPEDVALQKLNSDFVFGQGHNSSHVIAVLRIALYYATYFCHHNTIKEVEELYTTALWYSRLQKLDIVSGKLSTSVGEWEQAKKVLALLLEKPGVDVKLIVEFCKSFDIDVNEALCSYIEINLFASGGSLSNATNRDLDAPETATGVKNFGDNYHYAISCISNHGEKLLLILKEALQSFSPYDYEKIVLVLNELIKFSNESDQASFQKQLGVLQILSNYKRTVSPSEYELQYHSKESASSEVFSSPESSQERLPFHPLIHGNPWKIIAPELADGTTPKLLPLCRLLKMSEDQVYITAVENLVSSCLLDQHDSPTSSASSQTGLGSLKFEKAVELLSAVNNKEFVVKTAISLLTKWPQNEEKNKFAHSTVELAYKWMSSCEGDELHNAQKVFKIAQDVCQEITIQHILRSNGVTEEYLPKFKKFQRSKLICQLYEVYGCAPETSRPTVHNTTEEIAKIYNLNINKIRLHLVDTWLPSSCPGSIRSSEHCSSENKAKDRNNLKRVLYLLETGSVQQNVRFLLNYAYRSGPAKITYQSRVRAMEVLFNVASCEIIETVANDSLDGIRDYMKSLIYLAELEHLHLPQTVDSLQRCNKEGLVKGLWKNHKDNINAILLIADICLDSKFSDPQVWTNILKQLLLLGLTKYLSYILPLLTTFPNLWQKSNLIKVWEELTLEPLQKAVSPLSVEDRCQCERSMLLLQKCPLMVEVDIASFFQKLVHHGMLSYALACLPLLPHDKKPSNIGSLISSDGVNNILNVIANEKVAGKCFVCPDVIEGLVFEFVVTSSSYKALQSSEHFFRFANYLIAEKKVPVVIMEMIKLGEQEFAVKLAQYYQLYGSPVKNLHFKNDDSSTAGLNDLLNFLKNAGILEDAMPYLPTMNVIDVAEAKPELEFVNQNESSELASPSDVDIYDVF